VNAFTALEVGNIAYEGLLRPLVLKTIK
jgi:hypothetical protein